MLHYVTDWFMIGSAGRLQSAAVIIQGLQSATGLENLTQVTRQFYIVVDPSYLNVDWSEKAQRDWLKGGLLFYAF
jgi:hypothetical protein